MAEDTAKPQSGITKFFNNVAKHIFSPTMIFMMAAMAFPMISAAATTAGATATVGDLALGTIDMYWEMIKAPFTDGGIVADALGNAANGNFAPDSYEMGMMDHSNMAGGEHAGHVMGHGDLTSAFNDWKTGLSPEEWNQAMDNANAYGMTPEQYFENLPEAHR